MRNWFQAICLRGIVATPGPPVPEKAKKVSKIGPKTVPGPRWDAIVKFRRSPRVPFDEFGVQMVFQGIPEGHPRGPKIRKSDINLPKKKCLKEVSEI